MSKERGILFSAPMIRALLAGAKTQTRRAVRNGLAVTDICGGGVEPVVWRSGDALNRDAACPYGVPGDRLWVRETFRIVYGEARFRATCAEMKGETWRPSIFLPRKLSRITLEVTEVRVQRLQDISEEDARAEGVAGEPSECAIVSRESLVRGEEGCGDCDPCFGSTRIHRPAYGRLWDSINGAGSWASNPFVWAISFRRLP